MGTTDDGWVSVFETVAVQPWASVTVTQYPPLERPDMFFVVAPFDQV